jgi:hypothetical protein
VNKNDDYRQNADECLRMAAKTPGEENRAAWLRLAEGWLRMIKPDRASAAEAFQEMMRGTGQGPSKEAH